jgi:mannose-6-phosphate isomerase-like protein (cupin superfamily)
MIVNTGNAEHYRWGNDRCDGWHLIRSAELSVIQELVPAGVSEQRHFHHKARQVFYILDGSAVMELDGALHELHSGDSIVIEPGIPHQFMNQSDRDVKFLVISAPESHGDRVNLE